jgi:DMSO reductase family type II enzyme heme b subunit
LKGLTAEKKEQYSPGKAIGNPQSYEKPSAVDEIFAEGFGSSSVIENHQAQGYGVWKNGEWNVVIVRPLKYEGGSSLEQGKSAYMAFAVWQGAKKEVGARKSVTMSWVPLVIEK